MEILRNIPLAPLTTLQVGGPAQYFADAASESDVKNAVSYAAEHGLPLFVLGGGSNLLVADEGFPGLVLKISLRGVMKEIHGRFTTFAAAAGEPWDTLVAQTVDENCSGLECLSGIPGTVGGTPVQNVGAYGQEVAETIAYVRVLEIASGEVHELSNSDCKFSYRSSIFNQSERGRYIVLRTAYRLTNNGRPRLDYADLKNYFAGSITAPTLGQTRDAVRSIRQKKAMLIVEGDEDCHSAGSFFKNPQVTPTEADRIEALAAQRVPQSRVPRYPAENGLVKLSAAWLVEQAGFPKGYSLGAAGISRKHTLAIVNRGGATAKDILKLKDTIQHGVSDAWGVKLEPEPVFVGGVRGS